MKLFIPPLNSKFILVEPWSFPLYAESRNIKAAQALKLIPTHDYNEFEHGKWESHWVVFEPDSYKVRRDCGLTQSATLPAGTVISIVRYYIRAGKKDFDSVSFRAWLGKKSIRFWTKLADATPNIVPFVE